MIVLAASHGTSDRKPARIAGAIHGERRANRVMTHVVSNGKPESEWRERGYERSRLLHQSFARGVPSLPTTTKTL
jgi:hypothetical protein